MIAVRSACSAPMMAGIAMDTIVVSSRIMKKPMTSAHSARHAALESNSGEVTCQA
ncbi:hypothetical protein [Arthrobacter sp. JCM 19049]|uniref:hypothetical protein n=1 Tax=Arthrobacter sp. JCM 19049 TaxID=1460643 RepID=UPI000A42F9DA|nr:hypothetical protein [Arthrobacter sp. JCM 19049]